MRITTIGLIVLAAAATACGSSTDTKTGASAPATPAAATTAAADRAASGTYTRALTAADIARTDSFRVEGPNQVTPPIGKMTLKLTDSGIAVVDPTGFEIAETAAVGTDASLEIQTYVDPQKASFCGPEAPQNASYTWKLDGEALTLSPVEDRCADRNAILTGTWTRTP